jgi:DNA end-binding protein Ku
MPARSIGSATVSFGLVSIPVRMYVATHSEQPSFNLIHGVCKSRIKQQTWCPRCERVVERSELVKGREVAKDQYVLFTDEELKALEAAASQAIDIQEFVPLANVDPVYFQDTHYLGPDKGGDKAYQLLAEAMRDTGMVALAQHVSRGKERLVLIRPFADGLALHTLYYADEVRAFDEIERGPKATVKPAETNLARKLIEQLAADGFTPQQYHDHWRERLQEAVDQKIAGEEVAVPAVQPAQAKVIDLMEALKQSLSREGGRATPRSAQPVEERRRAAGGEAPRAARSGGKKK